MQILRNLALFTLKIVRGGVMKETRIGVIYRVVNDYIHLVSEKIPNSLCSGGK